MELESPQWVQEHWGGFIIFKPIWVKTLNFVIRNSIKKIHYLFFLEIKFHPFAKVLYKIIFSTAAQATQAIWEMRDGMKLGGEIHFA